MKAAKHDYILTKYIVKGMPVFVAKKIPAKISVIKISSQKSKALNFKYRKKNMATNVLSFRYGKNYGEILVCPEIIKKEAKRAGNSQKYQFAWMIVHGMLHLAGLHHEHSQAMARKAEKIETGILLKMFGSLSKSTKS